MRQEAPRLAVLDIDGVLADVRHRLVHLQRRPRDWAAFFGAIPADPPLADGVALAHRLAADHDIVYLTGRPERTRAATVTWLERHDLPAGRLAMRPDGDFRPARLLKPRLLEEVTAGRSVALVVDDDPDVCAAIRLAGWRVRRADWMGRPADLTTAQERLGRT